jgi:bacteriorhodopsin
MLEISAYSSLFIQFITGIIDVYGVYIPIPSDKFLFRDLLKVELTVQTIEFIFYMWMVKNLHIIKNITPYRYIDWFLTTPTMLVTFMAYLDINQYSDLFDFIKKNISFILEILFLNILMLLFGFLAELNIIPYMIGILLGFIPFYYYFKKIYDKYIKEDTTKDRKYLYWFFIIFWSLYGLAALMSYKVKNTMYNLLDLFAKNGFGIFLVYVVWTYRIKTE